MAHAKRPAIVGFIGIVLYAQAFLALAAGTALIVLRDSGPVLEATNQTSNALLGAGIAEVIVAVVLFLVARGLRSGSTGARKIVAVAQVGRMGVAVWMMMSHHTTAVVEASVAYILVGFFVLWALYGNEKAEEFFAGS
jgi:hypothetical protein